MGEQELCRGGVPAPTPPTEGSSWAYDLRSWETTAAGGTGAGVGKGRSGRSGAEVRACVCVCACL